MSNFDETLPDDVEGDVANGTDALVLDSPHALVNEIVVAGAGTGKTFALVHDYLFTLLGLDALGKPRSPHRVLAITFTDKAAAEMRRRVLLSLSELTRNPRANETLNARAKAVGVDIPDAKTLQVLLSRVPTAPIATFHSLAGNLLRDLALRANLDPGFSILDPEEERLLVEETAEAVVIDALAGADDAHKDEVANLVARFSLRRIGFSKGLVDALVSLLSSLAERGLCADSIPLAVRAGPANARVARSRGALGAALDALADESDANTNDAMVGRIARLRSSHAALFVALEESDEGSETRIAHAFEDLRSAVEQSFGRGTGHLRMAALRAMSTLSASLADQVAGPSAVAVRTLLQELEARVSREKDARGVLGFGDLLLKTRDLMRDDASVRARVKSRYDRILVDEYQDTSPVQEDLVALLAEEIGSESRVAVGTPAMGAVRIGSGRLFAVGDPKQSIYGFRGADAALFTHTLNVVTKGTSSHPPSGIRRTLAQSYRSLPAVCEVINLVAAASLNHAALGGVEFHPEDHLQAVRTASGATATDVVAGEHHEGNGEENDDEQAAGHDEEPELGSDEWKEDEWDDDDDDDDDDDIWPAGALWVPQGGEELNPDLQEAFAIARGVRQILFDDAPEDDELARTTPTLVADRTSSPGENASWRRPRPRDIAVLVRRHRAAGPIARALSHQGVPARVFGGEGFFGRPEVQDIIAALRLLTEPGDGLAVVSVLRSPLLALTDDEILALYELAPRKSPGLSFDQVALYAPDALDSNVAQRIAAFDALLRKLRGIVHEAPVSAFVDAFVDDGGYAVAIGIESDASDRIANLEKLRSMTEASRGGAVAAIARLWSALDDPPRVGPASGLPPDVDAVQVMTVHQAKGLEFPIVVVADLGGGMPKIRDDFLFDPEIGLAISVAGRGIEDAIRLEELPATEAAPAHDRIRAAMAERQHAELARVLYVAMTRARDHLFLVGEERKSKEMSLRRLIQMARLKNRRRFSDVMPEVKLNADPPPPRPIRVSALLPPTGDAPPPPTPRPRMVPSALGRSTADDVDGAARARVIPDLALARERGRQLHQLVARVGEAFSVEEYDREDLVHLAVCRAARACGLHPRDDRVRERIDAVVATLRGPLADLLRGGAELSFEEPLAVEACGVVINGTADIIARYEHETIVIDLKSSHHGTDADSTRLQLAAYAFALAHERDVPVRIGAWRIGQIDVATESFDEDLRQSLLAAIKTRRAQQPS